MSTTATASKVALEQLIDLSFKDHGWDVDKMHTTFDQLIAMLKAAKEEQSMGTQLLYLMKAYKTNPDNKEWMAHVHNMDSMMNSDQINDVQALQGNAKRYYTTLVNEGKWKKPKTVQNQSAFSGQSNSLQRTSHSHFKA